VIPSALAISDSLATTSAWESLSGVVFTREKIQHRGNFILTSTLVMKRDVWEETGSFDESMFAGETLDFVIRASRNRFSIGYVPEPLVLFRIKRERSVAISRSGNSHLRIAFTINSSYNFFPLERQQGRSLFFQFVQLS
jgi:GT2 family glycosyltransferase